MNSLFSVTKPVVGVIHVGALPGTPRNTQRVSELVDVARAEARLYREGGVDAIYIENMHEVPYMRGAVGPEIVAAMTLIGNEVKAQCGLPVGIQIVGPYLYDRSTLQVARELLRMIGGCPRPNGF